MTDSVPSNTRSFVEGCKACGQSKSAAYDRDNAQFALKQYKEWADPQIHDHGADVLEIERLVAENEELRRKLNERA